MTTADKDRSSRSQVAISRTGVLCTVVLLVLGLWSLATSIDAASEADMSLRQLMAEDFHAKWPYPASGLVAQHALFRATLFFAFALYGVLSLLRVLTLRMLRPRRDRRSLKPA